MVIRKKCLSLESNDLRTSITKYYASINVKPERGERGPRAYVGHLTSIAFPTLGNFTKNPGPRVGTFAFFAQRNGTKSQRPMCSSVRRPY